MSPLALLQSGEKGEIVALAGRFRGYSSPGNGEGPLEAMGLRPGKQVEMLTNSGVGPLLVRLDEMRLALGRGMAMKIYVQREQP